MEASGNTWVEALAVEAVGAGALQASSSLLLGVKPSSITREDSLSIKLSADLGIIDISESVPSFNTGSLTAALSFGRGGLG